MENKTDQLISAGGFEYGVKHFYTQKSAVLTELLFCTLHLEENNALELLNLGAIYVNNQRITENKIIPANQLCRVHTKPRRYNCSFNWLELIVFENSDFVVLNKPSGIPSHPSVDNCIENSLTQLAKALNINLLITHRLDTLTSGLIVYAKNNEFVKLFNVQMQNRLIEKKYVALVETTRNLPKQIIHYMEPSPRAPKKLANHAIEGWAFCELEILEQQKKMHYSWVKINLLTGRTHQIRSQLAACDAPLLGDQLYGAKIPYLPNAIALRAYELQFNWRQQRLVFNLTDQFED